MANDVQLNIDGKDMSLPVIEGTENEKGIVIGKLRGDTGYITLDPGFVNTGSCQSGICFVDGENGVLRYRGYPIEDLAEKATFLEVAQLLFDGELPNAEALKSFNDAVMAESGIPAQITKLCDAVSPDGHPMAVLSSLVTALSTFREGHLNPNDADQRQTEVRRLLGQLPTLIAAAFRHTQGKKPVAPKTDLDYTSNFLHMMFADDDGNYTVDPDVAQAMTKILILHADHEQNCSTSTVRVVGSSEANLYASISSGICALWGPLHGGANQKVIEMLESIEASGDGCARFIEKVKDKESGVRLMGFGHRVYKNFDPRARIIKTACDDALKALGINDPLLDIATELEQAALNDEYFIQRKLYPNVDFYSGIVYRALGIPTNMFTVMFALGRLPGWMAHWCELNQDPATRISRPRQIYTGEGHRGFVALADR
ncbi:MAG: citrate synthase [Planctomycetota bacterium]|jgi:citrate synthase